MYKRQTLDYAQALHEKRLLTYPRTDSKYITSDMQDSTKELITGLCSLLPFMRDVKLQADLIRVCEDVYKRQNKYHPPRPLGNGRSRERRD